MKRLVVASAAVVALVASACGSSSSSTTTGGTGQTTGGTKTKIGMALPGPKNDGGFNQSNYEGMVEAEKDYPVQGTVIDNVVDPQARIDALKNLAQAGNKLVIGIGAEFAAGGVNVAPQFPDTIFVIVNGQTSPDATNLHVYGIRQGVPAYVAAVQGAKLSTSKKIGFIGGELIPPVTQAEDAFKAAATATDPAVQVFSTVVGNFNDPVKAKAAASNQIASGVDFIYGFVDAGITGVIQAIQDSGKPVQLVTIIFPLCDQLDTVVATATLNTPKFIASIVKDYLDDAIPAQPKYYGVEDPTIQTVELCPNFKSVGDLQTITTQTLDGINDGSITLPAGV